jgi:hypothetical protein
VPRRSVGRRYRFRRDHIRADWQRLAGANVPQVALELGTIQCGGMVVRTPRRLNVPTFTSLDACLREVSVDFVLTATPRVLRRVLSPKLSQRSAGGSGPADRAGHRGAG